MSIAETLSVLHCAGNVRYWGSLDMAVWLICIPSCNTIAYLHTCTTLPTAPRTPHPAPRTHDTITDEIDVNGQERCI